MTIQEMADKISQTEDIEERKKIALQITEALRNQPELWAVFCPATRHYFLAKEENQLTAYIFSNEETGQNFIDEMRKRHIVLELVRNEKAERMLLFTELYRCGVMQFVLDSAQDYFSVPLNAVIPFPDYSKMPMVQRPILNPVVTGKMLLLAQEIRWGRADGNTELDALQEIYHSAFFHPFKGATETAPEEPGVYALADNKKFFMIFTDMYALKMCNPKDYEHARIVRFADLHKLLAESKDADGIIINPGSGAPTLLDMQLLELTQKVAEGDLSGIQVQSMNKDHGKIIVTKPEITPHDMINHVSDFLKTQPTVKSAYLRTIRKEEEIRPHYLMIITWTEDSTKEQRSEIREQIAKVALPFARGLNIEFISYHKEQGKIWAGSSEPFYVAESNTPEHISEVPVSDTSEDNTQKKKKKKGFFSGLFGKKS